ncbi:alpha/beta hydrolase [Fusibacter bizertensis]|uniref:Alpha/beta hydrolase n=1 Tax=Fusibacter bizertensis TaxID=1488331 RepID=A0ABT6NCK0_9FIRM|nr:alpha/beta hydrolase [Fusibacter bizertensis]MDH8678144.1 alpha/beta hydrolase [Fusibacter bizertensis]
MAKEPSIQGKIARSMIASIASNKLAGSKMKIGKKLKNKSIFKLYYPPIYKSETIEKAQFTMETLRKREVTVKCAILYLHGGGYVGKLKNKHRLMALKYCESIPDVMVLMPDYRTAPEHPYPAALEDALDAYSWLLEQGYNEDQIVIAGDSAGGGLALAVCLYLKHLKRKLPCAIVAMSPWTDMTASGASYHFNYENDPLFGNTKESLLYNRDYLGRASKFTPYVSPLFGDYSDFPPILIQVGSDEMLLSDSVRVAEKAQKDGAIVWLHIYEGMFHDFQMAGDLIPESKEAWKEVTQFLLDVKEQDSILVKRSPTLIK